jgi:hypothetical protein
MTIQSVWNTPAGPHTQVVRKDSQGRNHYTNVFGDPPLHVDKMFGQDSVQVTCDGKFKIGDLVRPTKDFIDGVLQGSIPYEYVAQWPKGYKIIEIGPEGFPWKGCHNIELEGFDVIGLTTEHIEKV